MPFIIFSVLFFLIQILVFLPGRSHLALFSFCFSPHHDEFFFSNLGIFVRFITALAGPSLLLGRLCHPWVCLYRVTLFLVVDHILWLLFKPCHSHGIQSIIKLIWLSDELRRFPLKNVLDFILAHI